MQYDALLLSELGMNRADVAGINVTSNSSLLVLSGRVLLSDYEAVLSEIFFQNIATEPVSSLRNISFIIGDELFRNTAFTIIEIIPTNDPAFIDITNPNITFNETTRDPLNLFSSNDTISDDDGDSLDMIRIVIYPTNDLMDILAADPVGTGLNVTLSTNPNDNTQLVISGTANFSTYIQVLQTVTFANNFPGIDRTTRLVNVYTFDGMTESPPHQIRIVIDPFDDPPICFFGLLVRTI